MEMSLVTSAAQEQKFFNGLLTKRALQRQPSRSGCKRGSSRAKSLRLGRQALQIYE